MKAWMLKALELLKASLEPPKHELNELDWKAALSPDKKRLAEQALALQRQIQNLRRTRDLLLPRLLSGQVNLKEN